MMMRVSPLSILHCWLICLFAWRISAADNITQPISIFRSRPDLVAPILTPFIRVPEKQAPGLYFVAPYQQIQESVHIFDNDCNLVYTGFGSIGPGIAHAPQTCMYKGEVHLCFYQGTQMVGWGHGHGVIMDKHYRVVKSVEPASYQASSDMHEFIVINNGTSALMTQYLRSVYDLCPWNLCDGLGYINEGAFQEVDVDSGEVIFEWRSLEHVDPSESWVGPGTTEISGSGEQPESPWDYFHINSIDKNDDGDYLISARHTSAVYKISGKDGHVIWRLNGAKSDYHLDSFTFSSQHDARFISDNDTHTVISLFNNAWNGFNQTSDWSTGQIISVDHRTKIATCLLNLEGPYTDGHTHVSRSQGNFQLIPGGNMLMGWGNDVFWTEYDSAGEVVFYGNLGWSNLMNYRVYKFDNWVGLPLTKPAMWTYSKDDSQMMIYVSWNGATEVRSWRFYGSNSKKGPWEELSTVPKRGFETAYAHDEATYKFTYAEALDKRGKVLSSSAVQQTFNPPVAMLEYCDDLACKFMPTSEEREAERKKLEEEEEEEKEKEAAEQQRLAEVARQEATKKKKAKIYGATLGVLGVLIVMITILATRNFVSRPLHTVVLRVWSTVVPTGTEGRSGLPLGVGYKPVSGLDDQDVDQIPMSREPA
ncbi:hypothetical protein LTS07_002166 [Exophiala sideris]|uniref:ASST-domain-containing protein n=1 Tax=Exophiala sideris TaxID=1016849 RepID=A0ABR0JLR1_9EURO|nr:hypothetical protein LTS07_002166 [Exophiala sideris]KAK5066822.1 hypothetical protein LTR69_002170 [Exophiala sideris]KAK5184881.1 hypothetical protein LTR44_002727 [Eurotiomycetes sp. CCFEE 6388]